MRYDIENLPSRTTKGGDEVDVFSRKATSGDVAGRSKNFTENEPSGC